MTQWTTLRATPRRLATATALFILGATTNLAADEPSTAAQILNQTLEAEEFPLVGEPFTLKLEVVHPRDTRLTLPGEMTSTRWEILDRRQFDQPNEGGQKTLVEFTFAVYRPGPSTLPSFSLLVIGYGDDPIELNTEPVTITIRSVLRDVNDPGLNDPRPPQTILADDYRPAWYAGIAGVLLLAALLFFFLRRRKEFDEEVIPLRPAHLVALEKLEALEQSGLLETGEMMIFYVRLSEAVREYLGRRYGFPGLELTTTEIIEELKPVTWPNGLTSKDVSKWLEYCDFVKFSGYLPPSAQGNASLARAFVIVRLTRPIAIAPETISAPERGEANKEAS